MASSSAGGKIRTSIFIVFLMVSMTWSAGINDIVSKYEPESELSDDSISLSILESVPSISYSTTVFDLITGEAMTSITPSNSGGAATSWSISPAEPAGLNFDTLTGEITGTPNTLQTRTEYTITATNSGGTSTAYVNITINDVVPAINYNPTVFDLTNGTPMSAVTPSNSGGPVITWWISPSLSNGLNFDNSNGEISGTPTGLLENTTYTVYANNSGGSTSTTFTLGLNWTLTPSAEGAFITRNSSIASDITWEWDYDPLEAQNLSLVTGEWNTCALDSNQNVFCWGRNGNGQIGNGQTGTAACGTSGHKCKDIPTATNDLGSDVISLAFGHYHTCAILDNGDVKCWGLDNYGQLGDGGSNANTNAPSSTLVDLGTGRTAVAVGIGDAYSCAILDNGETKCWGDDVYGQLGDGGSATNINAPSSTAIDLGTGRTAVALGGGKYHVCAILDNGEAKCWGRDNYGQLGDGGSNTDQGSPVAVSGSDTWDTTRTVSSGSGSGSGSSQSNFTASVEGADLYLDVPMTNITFQYNASAASGSGGGSGTTTNGNGTTWQVADISSGTGNSHPGQYMEILVGDTLYFSADDGSSGYELWAHDTSNASTWLVADIRIGSIGSNPGQYMQILVGDTLYFSANDGSSGHELWAHDTSNASTWRVADIKSGGVSSSPGHYMQMLVGDTLYFDAYDGSSGTELWAHDTSNASTWQVANIFTAGDGSGGSYPGQYMSILVGDTLYFSAADGSSGIELWAHDTSNASTWRVADINSGTGSSNPGQYMSILVGDTLYFSAADGSSGIELWAHDTSNASTWQAADINSGTGISYPGYYIEILVGDTLYFDAADGSSGRELWAHDTSNAS
ncbi:MAG: putative Ig domain-containing protein, partial [Candidatus Poseidoniaceae archaeon]|nr:putative Ig domain-containing protein [Candidatus Poseidoniaceae archaeon]